MKRAHPIAEQLRFTRHEWLRALEGVTALDATVHHGQMNSISWIVGHLANHEQRVLLVRTQKKTVRDDLAAKYATGAKMITPELSETLGAWRGVTAATEPYLDALTTSKLVRDLAFDGKRSGQSVGSAIRRMTFHYWFHIGEILAIRQMIGGKSLPEYVGPDLEKDAPYRADG